MNNNQPNNKTAFPEPSFRPWKYDNGTNLIYYIVLAVCVIAGSVLPLIIIDISITAPGIVRPANERAQVKPVTTGTIISLPYRTGDKVAKDSTLVMLQDPAIFARLKVLNDELKEKYQLIRDLKVLSSSPVHSQHALRKLVTPEYRKQLSGFIYHRNEKETGLKKLTYELALSNHLFDEMVIAKNEVFEKQIEVERAKASFHSFINQQLAAWHQLLSDAILQMRRLEAERQQLLHEQSHYRIKAPISGVIQMMMPVYEGSTVQPGDIIYMISPEARLVAECFVETRHIAFLNTCNKVSFQIDALPYNYFGLITGRILSIDNDFSLMNNRPVFKVYCSFDQAQLSLKNGYTGQLRKGMTLQARFFITRRSAWQLLFDKVNDWFNPELPADK